MCVKQRLRDSFLSFFCAFQLVFFLKKLDFLVFFENRHCNFCQALPLLHMKINISHVLSPEMSQAEDLVRESSLQPRFLISLYKFNRKPPNFERNRQCLHGLLFIHVLKHE